MPTLYNCRHTPTPVIADGGEGVGGEKDRRGDVYDDELKLMANSSSINISPFVSLFFKISPTHFTIFESYTP